MPGPNVRHRLLAILAADAVGYSRLMTSDGMGTLQALELAREIFGSHIQSHGGRVIDTAGDSVLGAFETAGGALIAALENQEDLDAQLLAVANGDRLRFRIGIHLGDVMEKTADSTCDATRTRWSDRSLAAQSGHSRPVDEPTVEFGTCITRHPTRLSRSFKRTLPSQLASSAEQAPGVHGPGRHIMQPSVGAVGELAWKRSRPR